ncbi:MAG TPA: hypothetical protein VMS31_16895 [Pyrinomonadaceae bacterium]|nr:hypothetical protein [Pyrinomonadaceae bacterium]
MTQLSIMIALLVALAFGNATRSGVNPIQEPDSGDSISQEKVLKGESPKDQLGGGEGGWPGF